MSPDHKSEATARASLACGGWAPLSDVVPFHIRALGRVLGRSWKEAREADLIKRMQLVKPRSVVSEPALMTPAQYAIEQRERERMERGWK